MNPGDLLIVKHYNAVIFLDIANNIVHDIDKGQLLLFISDEYKNGYKVLSFYGVGNISPAYTKKC